MITMSLPALTASTAALPEICEGVPVKKLVSAPISSASVTTNPLKCRSFLSSPVITGAEIEADVAHLES